MRGEARQGKARQWEKMAAVPQCFAKPNMANHAREKPYICIISLSTNDIKYTTFEDVSY